MQSYISALLDLRSKFDSESVSIDCKHLEIAEKVHSLIGGELKGSKIEITNVDEFYKNYSPCSRYEEYRVICMEKLIFPSIKQDPDHEYMAAIFDLTGSFKVARKGDGLYGNVTFRNKSTFDALAHFYKKSCNSQIYFSGEELLWALEHLKEFLLIKKECAEVLCDCVSNPDDPSNWPAWQIAQDKISKK